MPFSVLIFNITSTSLVSATQPTTYTLNEAKTGKQLQVIENNEALGKKLKGDLPAKEFCFKNGKGNELNAYY
jgi:dipeptidyl-peptidase-4